MYKKRHTTNLQHGFPTDLHV